MCETEEEEKTKTGDKEKNPETCKIQLLFLVLTLLSNVGKKNHSAYSYYLPKNLNSC